MFLLSKDYWEVRGTAKKGRGVFATKMIPAGTVIGDYIGKIVPTSEADIYDTGRHFYLMYYHRNAFIYPLLNRIGIHLLNHSCTPNAWMYTYKGHTLFFSIRAIFPGEEITLNYLLEPQDEDCKPCKHLCQCGSDFCRQTMHLSQKELDLWWKFDQRNMKKTKKAKVKPGHMLPFLSQYPKTIADNETYTLFGNPKKRSTIIKATSLPSAKIVRKQIRETGRTLRFPSLNLQILGVKDNTLITKTIN